MSLEHKGSPIVELGVDDFIAHVQSGSLPTLVAFSAPWSQPCQTMLSVLEEMQAQRQGQIRVFYVNVDLCLDLSIWYNIEMIPTFIWFVAGKMRARIVGATSQEKILSFLETLTPPKSA